MEQKSVEMQIVEAIKNEECRAILALFKEWPEKKNIFTPFGGQTWLGYTAQLGKLESLKTLIAAGIDVNLGDKRDNRGPVCSAAANNHCNVVEYLLINGAELDVTTSLTNALFSSIVGRSPKITKLLLEAGINSRIRYNSKTMKNMDAVAFAVMRGEKECALLIAIWNANGDEAIAQKALKEADLIAKENAR